MDEPEPFPYPRDPSEEEFESQFAPYALEIGYLAQSWNLIQDTLGMIFAVVVNRNNTNVGLAVWHSLKSDRAQREALKAAVNKFSSEGRIETDKAKADILWLLAQVEQHENRRNDAIHAPIAVFWHLNDQRFVIQPWTMYENPRAKKMNEKDILAELKWYRALAKVLRNYSTQLYVSIFSNTPATWPERPQLPTRGQSQNHRPTRRRTETK